MSENLKAAIVDGVRILNLDIELKNTKIYHFETGACSSGVSSMEQVHYLQKSGDKIVVPKCSLC